ncbi:MAG: 1-acyl-sn-glycerol-3-phosphate acyltransferase, partial [Deltaproteobacteria bacterium]|nr:1-acyl-sn-glycerol-3-phosphate acyltransferase [Deltaproteobacteria bacterium]
GNAVHSVATFWMRIILFISGVRVEIKGIENIPPSPVTFVSNHKGAFDIPVLQASLPLQFRWVATRGLFNIPLVGWAMRLAGYIAIDRTDAGEAVKSIGKAAERIKRGTSVLVFPEGTRNEGERLLPFKRGVFLLSVRSGAPVVPVAIKGTEKVMKRGSLSINPATVRVSIGRPIKAGSADERELMSVTKEALQKELDSL